MVYKYKGANKKGSPQYEAHKKYMREYHVRKRFEAMELLGNCCKLCGYSNFKALEFDHINNDGAAERKNNSGKNGGGWTREIMYHQIIKGEREDIQLLCANCHRIKTYDTILLLTKK